jgi:hypothetical protein
MRVLFDQGTPRGIARWLLDHTVNVAKPGTYTEVDIPD